VATSEVVIPGPYPKAYERFPKIRQSTLSSFDSCGLSSKFEFDYRKGWSTHPQARGQILHRVAARCLRDMHRHNEEQIPVDAALAHLHDALRQADVDRTCPACGSHKIRPGVKDGNRTCEECGARFPTELMNLPMNQVKDLRWIVAKWATDNTWDIANLMDVEQRLETAVEYPNPAGGFVRRLVTGQLDTVFLEAGQDDHAIVLDWKDTWGLPGPTDISFGGYFQQRMYGWLLMRNYSSLQRVTLREFYVRFSEPREVTMWREDLDDVEQEFTALVERFDRAVHDNAFTPTPGKHCGWCMRPGACPILPEARDEGRVRTQAQADQLTRELMVSEAHAKLVRKALANWAEVHGAIPIKDAKGPRVLGFRETERTERPTREALELAIRMAGPDGLKLDELYRKHKSTRFDQHRAPRERLTDDEAVILAQLEGSLAEARAAHPKGDA
jgi:hypothetical protein